MHSRRMTKPERIGVLGGTFDPIHNAHLDMARAALESARLDRVLFVLSARPPHKRDDTVASPEQRLDMLEAALESEAKFEPCDLELHREGPSYMWETLRDLEEQYRGADLFLIVGLDSLLDFPNWKDPEDILEHARLLVAPREGDGRVVPASLEGKYDFVPFEESDVSSTDIRDRVSRDEPIDALVPAGVLRLIREQGFYDG